MPKISAETRQPLPILQKEDSILRQKAEIVPVVDIATSKIKKIVADMTASLATQKDGIAIAAPQIGASVRIFVVNGELLAQADKEYKGESKPLVFINPKITKLSKEKVEMEEGCLSVRWLYGTVRRATRATIEAYDEEGRKFERGASGLLAQIFQHETDHLDGVLFTDRAGNVREMTEEEIAEAQQL